MPTGGDHVQHDAVDPCTTLLQQPHGLTDLGASGDPVRGHQQHAGTGHTGEDHRVGVRQHGGRLDEDAVEPGLEIGHQQSHRVGPEQITGAGRRPPGRQHGQAAVTVRLQGFVQRRGVLQHLGQTDPRPNLQLAVEAGVAQVRPDDDDPQARLGQRRGQ